MNIQLCNELIKEVKEKRTTIREAHSVLDMLYQCRVICFKRYRYLIRYVNTEY